MNTHTGVDVIENSLPVFPGVVCRILETLDEAEAGLSVLIEFLDNEPAVKSRVLSFAELSGVKYH